MAVVTIKLPPFWTAQPAVWFQQAEAQFVIRGITTEQTKYYHVISALDQDTAGRLIDFLQAPPDQDQYAALKTRLLATYSISRRDRASRILHMEGLGDRLPSVVMDELLSLMDNHTPCLLFEQVFLELLPSAIRIQLSDVDFTDLRAVARRADALWQIQQGINAGSGIHKVSRSDESSMDVFKVTTASNQQRLRQPTPVSTNPEWCFYHQTYGDKARKCKAPCSFSGNALAGRR